MRIVVSSQGMDLSSGVDPRFARAPYFLVFDTSDESLEVVKNDEGVNAAHGAGIQAAENITGKNVDIVVSGNSAPEHFRLLRQPESRWHSWRMRLCRRQLSWLKTISSNCAMMPMWGDIGCNYFLS